MRTQKGICASKAVLDATQLLIICLYSIPRALYTFLAEAGCLDQNRHRLFIIPNLDADFRHNLSERVAILIRTSCHDNTAGGHESKSTSDEDDKRSTPTVDSHIYIRSEYEEDIESKPNSNPDRQQISNPFHMMTLQ